MAAVYVGLNFYFPYHLPEDEAHFGFWGDFLPQTSWISQILAPAFVFGEALLINSLFNRNDFLDRNTFTPALLYFTLMSGFHCFYFLDGFAVAQFCVIMALHQLYQLYQNEDGRRQVFNIGFWLGVACTFHPVLVLLLVVAFWLVWVIRPFVMRESILMVVGFLIPLMYGGFYSAWAGIKIQNEQITASSLELNIEDVIVIGGLTFLFILLSLGTITRKFQQSSIRLKKLFRIILILINTTLLLTILEYFFFHKKEALAMVFIPLMFVLPYAFGFKKLRDVTTIAFYFLLLFSLGRFIFPLQFLEFG
ncbi:MAG: hypothetical protein DCO96_04045 [Fluviicola sp. XM-24bin1]|nr:MAG: hypothetical protein DCO96_04045 [Fluviicola sp. XM-24bin1]